VTLRTQEERNPAIEVSESVRQPLVPHLALYLNFLEYVGAEDDRIRKEMREGATHGEKRTNYSDAIGVDKDDEETILSILLEAYRGREEIQKQRSAVENESGFAAARGDQQGVAAAQAKEAELVRARARILSDMWAQLKRQLGDDSLRKLDAYVNREFSEEPELTTIH
jgi:hypothetical protein